jgi:hypothetical protein
VYLVREMLNAYNFPTLARDFPRRSAAEAWLVDFVTEMRGTIIDRAVDDDHDAIDFMVSAHGGLRQFMVERQAVKAIAAQMARQ